MADISNYRLKIDLQEPTSTLKKLKGRSRINILQRCIINKSSSPISFFAHGFFWCIIFVVICPFLGVGLLAFTLYQLILKSIFESKINMEKGENGDVVQELAVIITGCDTGFGQSYSYSLAKKGFHVFAGCLSKEGMAQYDDFQSITAFKLDVTIDDDVNEAACLVSKWLSEKNIRHRRFLHAVINNAGIGSNGPIDWTPTSDFERVMEINYFGMIRTTKAFLPILKKQSCADEKYEQYKNARIITMGSFAGHIALPGSPAYVVSKHAVESFSSILRLELKAFDIPVVTINPSVHGTTMLDTSIPHFEQKWQNLSEEVKRQYGEGTFNRWCDMLKDVVCITWEAKVVTDLMLNCVELIQPPPEVIAGTDAKYILVFLKMLPTWMMVKILTVTSPVGRSTKLEIMNNLSSSSK